MEFKKTAVYAISQRLKYVLFPVKGYSLSLPSKRVVLRKRQDIKPLESNYK